MHIYMHLSLFVMALLYFMSLHQFEYDDVQQLTLFIVQIIFILFLGNSLQEAFSHHIHTYIHQS